MNLYQYVQKPKAYAPSPSIWTDEHISGKMLQAHLDADRDAASYGAARRERVCAFLWDRLRLEPSAKLLDLGCGPGLYAQWFAKRGVRVRGLDISKRSLDHARARAAECSLAIDYVQRDYRQPLGAEAQDAAIMVYEDYGVLAPQDRRRILANILDALKPGGAFALDVMSLAGYTEITEASNWTAESSGFWRPHPYVVLKKTFLYPDFSAYCDLYLVCDEQISAYYTHQTAFSPESIAKELAEAGFHDVALYGNLEGAPLSEGGKHIGVIAMK